MKENQMAIPQDFLVAVKDIKLAILQARARAARASNVEALKLYFFVGGYVSKKTRTAKWGTGAIDALSERLQVELPGLRGFSPANIKYMRIFFEAWGHVFRIQQTPSVEFRKDARTRQKASDESRPVMLGETSFGLLLCEKVNKPVVQLTVQGYSQPIGIATYQALKNIPQPYKSLAPVIDGVRKAMVEYKIETDAPAGVKSANGAKKRKGSAK